MPDAEHADAMRRFWDERARENAAYYVDTSLDYEHPDMQRFFETGHVVVKEALFDAPVQPERTGLAVEIGSGLGRISKALGATFDEVVGLDISASMVEQARELVPDEHVRFEVGDGSSLRPLADASADFICTFTVFQHQRSRDLIAGYLVECGRVLKPGGVLAAQWNNLPPLKYRLDTIKWKLRRKRLDDAAATRTAAEFRGTTATVKWIRAQLAQAGLQVAGTKGEGTLFAWVWARKR